jgi:hypothetical protein
MRARVNASFVVDKILMEGNGTDVQYLKIPFPVS